jgi:DNA polymerase elongation subunit (family B)
MPMKILLVDLEVSPTLSWHWGQKMWEEQIIEVVEPSYMLSVGYQWLGEKTQVKALCDFEGYDPNNKCDKDLVKFLRGLLSEAEIVIGQNSDKFDIKYFNTRCIIHKLPPPEPYKTLDTLKINKKHFKFISNKLDVVSSLLGHGRKVEHEGFPLWKKCMSGDLHAWERMKKYNKRDVDLTAEVYLDVLPWIQQVQPVWSGTQCIFCKSTDVIKWGFKCSMKGTFRRHFCRSCSKFFRGAKIINRI